jgi:hypothetical protein
MKIKNTTRIESMILVFPQLEDVFELHDVDLDDDVISMSIKQVCRHYELDIDDIMGDLRAALSDSAGEGWLVGEPGEDYDDDSFDDDDDYSSSEDESEEEDYAIDDNINDESDEEWD